MKDNLPLFSVMRRTLFLAVSTAVLSACEGSPVEWTHEKALRTSGHAIALTAGGDTVSVSERTVEFSGACPASVRVAHSGTVRVAVWWEPRPDSGARLMAAHSNDDGASWSAPAPVDTLDRSVVGCRRPPASIAMDSSSGYVHVSYALVAPEGTGIFFAHSMDRGVTFHAPVAILYGDRPGYTSVAADGDLVAVAFEDPNGNAARVGLALSHTMGHIFEDRVMPVSADNGAATQPLVALAGRKIAVAWHEGASARGDTVLRVRAGTIH
jgi:hypothetical protein